MKVLASKQFWLPSLYRIPPVTSFLSRTLFPSALHSQKFQYMFIFSFWVREQGSRFETSPCYLLPLLTFKCFSSVSPQNVRIIWNRQRPPPSTSHMEFTHGAEPFFRSRQLCSYSRTSQHFMEPEGSLPYSQEPSTGPYPEPDRSSPHHPILSKIHFNIVHPPTSWSS
jgi:hypothetical protein